MLLYLRPISDLPHFFGNGNMLRAKRQAVPACDADIRAMFFPDTAVAALARVASPIDMRVVIAPEYIRNAHARWAGHTITAVAAGHFNAFAVQFRSSDNSSLLRFCKRFFHRKGSSILLNLLHRAHAGKDKLHAILCRHPIERPLSRAPIRVHRSKRCCNLRWRFHRKAASLDGLHHNHRHTPPLQVQGPLIQPGIPYPYN